MNRAPLIMATVAGVAGAGGLFVITRPVRSEAGVYGRRIAGTMLLALAIILGGFAHALATFGAMS
jgi:hypothetical protein